MLQVEGRAGLAAILGQINFAIVQRAGARRQGHGRAEGARLPVSVAGAAVSLGVIEDPGDLKTPIGYKTARRRLPPVLEALEPRDPRRMAADALASSVERLGASGGLDLSGGSGYTGPSDGGATTKIKHAARVRMIEAAANGWPCSIFGEIERGRPRAVLSRGKPQTAQEIQARKRLNIMAFPALVAVCVEGRGLFDVLAAHGWSRQSPSAKVLAAGILAALDDVAEALGYGRAVQKKTLDC